ncbi:MAG: hypothetical protein ACI37J_08925 [Candidatus Bruticola sp.]
MVYDGAQSSDQQGWSKPRFKQKKHLNSAEGQAAKANNDNGEGSGQTGGLKAKIRARREQEQLKGVSQGIKARSKAFNQKQEEKAAQEEVGGEVVGKKRSANKKKFKNNKLFGLTLLAPGLDECDPEGVAALDGTLAAYLGQAPAAQSAGANESCSARHPAPDAEPLPIAAPSNSEPQVALPVSPLRPYQGPPREAAPERKPYIPGFRSASPASAATQAQASMPPVSTEEAAPTKVAANGAADKLQLSIPTSPLRPYKAQQHEVASERRPYIPGIRSASAAGATSAAAPNFGTGTASVYSAPVSAVQLGASASKNTVLPLPVGRGHKGPAQKKDILHEGGDSYRSSARANSNDDFGGHVREAAELNNESNYMETIPPEEDEAETTTEGKSLIELLESVPVAKRKEKGPSRYV